MRKAAKSGKPARRLRPFRRLRRKARRWRWRIINGLGLGPHRSSRGYMICATWRTGSTYLGQLLSSTGALGCPREYFNTEGQRARYDRAYPGDRLAQLDIILTRGATSNGIYAVKVISPQLLDLRGHIDPFHDLPNLALVRMRRQDVLGQAISVARARQTGQFLATDPQRRAPVYDFNTIRHGLRSIEKQQALWDHALAGLRVQSLSITYEEVLAGPQSVVDRIASHLGVRRPVPIDPARVTHTMQRDGLSVDWRQRFLAEAEEEFRYLADR